jgi:cell wall-associated NlpC family hydrolase
MGGSRPSDGFDNSGFIYYVLNQNGIDYPRLTRDQILVGTRIEDFSELQIDDVIYFNVSDGNNMVLIGGIYLGGEKMIYASSSAGAVRESDISQGWYKDAFDFAIRMG